VEDSEASPVDWNKPAPPPGLAQIKNSEGSKDRSKISLVVEPFSQIEHRVASTPIAFLLSFYIFALHDRIASANYHGRSIL
jgi:hypothetical protein